MSYNILLAADQKTIDRSFAAFIAKCEAENDAISRRYEAEALAQQEADGTKDGVLA